MGSKVKVGKMGGKGKLTSPKLAGKGGLKIEGGFKSTNLKNATKK